MLMKDACQTCSAALGFTDEAYVCSYECTFCPQCAAKRDRICPNCGGELVVRPRRFSQT
jgi:hypothetical protein